MPAVEACVDAPRAARYLAQLCGHLKHLQELPRRHDAPGAGPPAVISIQCDDSRGSIEFDLGMLTLQATAGQLLLGAHSEREADLATLQRLVGDRVAAIGRRDALTVQWQPAD